MSTIETKALKMPEVIPQEKTPVKESPWFVKESARMIEKNARENIEAGQRMRARVEARQAAIKENTLSIYRLNKANRERPIRKYEAKDAAAREAAAGLWTPSPEEAQPRKTLLNRITERLGGFLALPNREAARLREVELQSYEAQKKMAKDTARGLGKASSFLRGVATTTFNYLNNTTLSVKLEKRSGKNSTPSPSGTNFPNPRTYFNK